MPSLPPDVKGYLFYDGVWNDVSNKMRQTSPITITRGADSEQGENSPTKAELVMDNRSGAFSPRNPESPLFGKIGRNTPMKIAIEAGPPYLLIPFQSLFNESALVAQDSAQMDFTGDVDLRIELSSNDFATYDVGSALGFASRWEFTGNNRCWWWGRSQQGNMYFAWTEDGLLIGTGGSVSSTAPIPFFNGERVAMRVTVDVDNGAGGYTVRFYYSNQIDGEWVQLGDDVVNTSAGSTFIFNGNGDADIWIGSAAESMPATGGSADMIDGKLYAFQMRQGINGPLMIDFDAARDAEAGDTAIVDGSGQAWALQEDASFSNEYVRIHGEVPSWPPDRDLTGNNKFSEIQPTGVTRRLDAGNKPLESALLRYLRSIEGQPIDCWPMIDGVQSQGGASLNGGQAANFWERVGTNLFAIANQKYEWAGGTIASWLEPVGLAAEAVAGYLLCECREDATANTSWAIDFFFTDCNDSIPEFEFTDRTVATDVDGTITWNMVLNRDTDALDLLFETRTENAGSTALLEHLLAPGIFDKQPHHIRLQVDPGATSDYFIYVDGQLLAAGTYPVPSMQLKQLKFNWFLDSEPFVGFPYGFITYWGLNYPPVDQVYNAFLGFPGDKSGARFERLMDEQGLVAGIGSNGGSSGEQQFQEEMGTQGLKKFIDLLQQCANTDIGIFAEMRDDEHLYLRARSTMYNQAPRFTLDFSEGVISAPFKPLDDDKLTENDVQVTRIGGSNSKSVDTTSSMSIQDPPNGVGRYDVNKELSLYQDSQTANLAGWFLHMGTFDGLRYTRLTVDLANPRVYEMFPQIMNTDLGDVIRITNLPKQYGPDDVDLIVRGYTEEIGPDAWKITFNCSPGETFQVASAVLDIFEDFEDAILNVDFTNAGSASWARSTNFAHTGTNSYKSGAIAASQTSSWIVTVPSDAEKIEFWYKTDSSSAGTGDRLIVLVDAATVLTTSGIGEWTVFSADVSAASTVTFRYAKDAATTAGTDAVYIDGLRFRITSPYGGNADTDGSALSEAINTVDTSFLVETNSTTDRYWVSNYDSPADFPLDVKMGGERLQVNSIMPPLADQFSRVFANTWDGPTVGPAWQQAGGVAADYNTTGTTGTHTLSTVNVSRRSFIDWDVEPDCDVYVDVGVSAVATGGSIFGGPTLRHQGANDLYMWRLDFNTSGNVVCTLRKRVASVETSLVTFTPNIPYVANTMVRTRFQVKGSRLRAKVWLATDGEPNNWQATVTDTDRTDSPFVGLRSISATGNTNVNPLVIYDNYVMVSPQQFTVLRSQNGVVKSQTIGTAVELFKTPIVPL